MADNRSTSELGDADPWANFPDAADYEPVPDEPVILGSPEWDRRYLARRGLWDRSDAEFRAALDRMPREPDAE